MIYLISLGIVVISALLWRIRGGLWKKYIPANKIWYALFFGVCGYFHFGNNLEKAIVGFICCYASYQLYGWGLYIGRLLEGGKLNPNLVQYRECELIDDLLYSCRISFKGKTVWLYEYPKLFGFCGVTLTGLIITFLWGLYFGSLPLMLSGLAMGLSYWLGGKLEKLYAIGKSGWNWGEFFAGIWFGSMLASQLLF